MQTQSEPIPEHFADRRVWIVAVELPWWRRGRETRRLTEPFEGRTEFAITRRGRQLAVAANNRASADWARQTMLRSSSAVSEIQEVGEAPLVVADRTPDGGNVSEGHADAPSEKDAVGDLVGMVVGVSVVGAIVGAVLLAVFGSRKGHESEVFRRVGLTLFAIPFAEAGMGILTGAYFNLRARKWWQGLGLLVAGIVFTAVGIGLILFALIGSFPPDSGGGDGGGGD